MKNRREFLKLTAMAGGAVLLAGRWQKAFGQYSQGLRKFIHPLPRFGVEIPAAAPDTSTFPGTDYYNLRLGQYTQWLHPDLPKPTTLWGYADGRLADPVFRHLGGAIIAQKDRPVRIKFKNDLPAIHPLPIDRTLCGAEGAVNRAVAHLHGGHVPWASDGGPYAWAAPDGSWGPSRIAWLPDAAGTALTDDTWYPNDQSARLMWFHDHAMGNTRLNAYAGLASAYVLRDAVESALVASGAIPGAVDGTEMFLVIQDKAFKQEADQWGMPGDLDYPSVYDADIEEGGEPPEVSCVPEYFGDTMLVNGVVYPYAEIEPRRYRLRILNACNARFCRLQLFYAQSNDFPGSTEAALNKPGPAMVQIGTEGGFLPEPAMLQSVVLAPAERADMIVDFSDVPVGAKLILYSEAAAPFPMGGDDTDFFAGNKKNDVVTQPGYGPNTRTLMQFRVGPRVGAKDPRPAPLKLPAIAPLTGATVMRDLTLNEGFDEYGRLIQMLGTNEQMFPGTFARGYMDEATETPIAGATEIWRVFNLTGDTHPIHMHLTNAQVIGRRKFKVSSYSGTPQFTGPMRLPDANEAGWKETIRMNPGDMTELIMRFDLPAGPAGVTVPQSPRTGGHEYVWHCHILEHEEHDMMRPLIVSG
jgi:spore coat protein A, manganese oxidase